MTFEYDDIYYVICHRPKHKAKISTCFQHYSSVLQVWFNLHYNCLNHAVPALDIWPDATNYSPFIYCHGIFISTTVHCILYTELFDWFFQAYFSNYIDTCQSVRHDLVLNFKQGKCLNYYNFKICQRLSTNELIGIPFERKSIPIFVVVVVRSINFIINKTIILTYIYL